MYPRARSSGIKPERSYGLTATHVAMFLTLRTSILLSCSVHARLRRTIPQRVQGMFQLLVSTTQQFRQNLVIPYYGHDVCITQPAWHAMHVNEFRKPSSPLLPVLIAHL